MGLTRRPVALTTATADSVLASTLVHVFSNGLTKALGLDRLAGWIARYFGIYVITDPAFGAAPGAPAADNAIAIQACIDASAAAGAYFTLIPPGLFAVDRSIHIPSKMQIHGMPGAIPYNVTGMRSVLWASPDFATDTPVLDLRNATETGVRWLGIGMSDATGAGKLLSGLEYGDRGDFTLYGLHEIEHCSIHEGEFGIRARNAGILKARFNNISHHSKCGVLLDACGDFDLDGNYVNSCNTDYTGSDDFTGAGIVIANGGNGNIRGGKVEWNAKGLLLYSSHGITVSGVNFDVNRVVHIWVVPADDPLAAQALGFSITGNRFLSGGTNFIAAASLGAAHIQVSVGAGRSAVGTISGNTFRKGGPLAFDLDPSAPVGPLTYGISVQGSGTARVVVCGNDLYEASGANAIGAFGADIVVAAFANYSNLPSYIDGGARVSGFGEFDVEVSNSYKVNGNQVLRDRATGWAPATGTATRTAFDTATATTADVAERLKALVDDLIGHGLIGA